QDLLGVDLGRASGLFYIVLFVITGASLPVESLFAAGGLAVAVVAARLIGKGLGVLLIAPLGGLNARQVIGLAATLLPMSSLALLLQHDIAKLFPGFGKELAAVVIGAVIIMELVGPLAVHFGFKLAGEDHPEET